MTIFIGRFASENPKDWTNINNAEIVAVECLEDLRNERNTDDDRHIEYIDSNGFFISCENAERILEGRLPIFRVRSPRIVD